MERSLASFADALQHAFDCRGLAEKTGSCKSLDPRIKIVAILPLILIAALARQLWVIAVLFAVADCGGYAVESSPGHAGKKSVVGRARFHRAYFVSRSFPESRAGYLRLPLLGWSVTAQGLRAASHSDHAGGNSSDFFRPWWCYALPGATCSRRFACSGCRSCWWWSWG